MASAPRTTLSFLLVPLALVVAAPAAEKGSAPHTALELIRAERLGQYVTYLADDYFEGREAGSRGGREVGDFLAQHLKEMGLKPAGSDGYFQPFGNGLRNVIGLLPGRDPKLKDQIVVVEAHYDHVGYGKPYNSYGPIGHIHNGADDNASGTTGILCVAQALLMLEQAPKRSVLFIFSDGEEMGLPGAKHWLAHPTLPLEHAAFMLNVDMIGRLRDNHVIVYGTRTGYNLRRTVSLQNDELALGLDFTWELKPNGDHWPFFQHDIPVLLIHTGEHEDYHRPSDKADRINRPGMERVTRLIFRTAYELAEAPQISGFRKASQEEPRKEPPAAAAAEPRLPERLGALWQAAADGMPGVQITWVYQHMLAEKAGLRPGDRVTKLGDRDIRTADDMAMPCKTPPRTPRWSCSERGLLRRKAPGRRPRGRWAARWTAIPCGWGSCGR